MGRPNGPGPCAHGPGPLLLLNGGLIAGQEPLSAALAAEKTSFVSAEKTSVASRAKTSVASAEKTPDILLKSTTPWGGAFGAPPGCGG